MEQSGGCSNGSDTQGLDHLGGAPNTLSFDKLAERVLDKIYDAYERDGKLPGLSTGLSALNEKIDGLQDGHLIVLAARPGMGKTALATNMAFALARDMPVGFLSLEQPVVELVFRIFADVSGFALKDLKRGDLEEHEIKTLRGIVKGINTYQLHLRDTFARDWDKIKVEAAALKDAYDIKALFVDYLQLARGTDVRARHLEISQICQGLKELAKVLNIPVVALSQVNREAEKGEDNRPSLGNLKEGSAIEENADVVLLLYRKEYYLKQKAPPSAFDFEAQQQYSAKLAKDAGQAEIIIAKNRHGECGSVRIKFDAARMRFSDLGGADG